MVKIVRRCGGFRRNAWWIEVRVRLVFGADWLGCLVSIRTREFRTSGEGWSGCVCDIGVGHRFSVKNMVVLSMLVFWISGYKWDRVILMMI